MWQTTHTTECDRVESHLVNSTQLVLFVWAPILLKLYNINLHFRLALKLSNLAELLLTNKTTSRADSCPYRAFVRMLPSLVQC